MPELSVDARLAANLTPSPSVDQFPEATDNRSANTETGTPTFFSKESDLPDPKVSPLSPNTPSKATGNIPNIQHGENRHFFGLKTNDFHPQQDVSDDYEQRFPEDPMYEETGPTARVWRTYLAESGEFDQNMVGEARDGLDALLVFAGLFSAVVTGFVVQTSENLQVDYTQMSALLLSELIAVQRAMADGSSVNSVPASALNLTTNFTPNALDVWVNGLWVVSLALSLMVALSAVLVKQWLHRYVTIRSGTPKDRSLIRHSKYMGFEKWQVLGIIGALPVIMHLSLALFFLGLILFLMPLRLVLSCIIGAMTFVVYALYLVMNTLPVFLRDCPYQTPLSDCILLLLRKSVSSSMSKAADSSSEDGETRKRESLSVEAVHWLYNISSNPSVHSIVLQAIGGFHINVSSELRQAFAKRNTLSAIERLLLKCTLPAKNNMMERQAKLGLETVAERLMRASFVYGSDTQYNDTELWIRSFNSITHISFPTRSSDPRFEAVSHALEMDGRKSFFRSFILSYRDVPLHPLIWIFFLRTAIRKNVFNDYVTDPIVFEMLFPAMCAQPTRLSSSSTLLRSTNFRWSEHRSSEQTITMNQTIRSYMHEEICEYLSSLASSDTIKPFIPPTSRAARALVITMESLVHHVSADPSNLDSGCWEIISNVLSHYDSQYYPVLTEQRVFLRKLAMRLVQQTAICGSLVRGSAISFSLRSKLLMVLGPTWYEHPTALPDYEPTRSSEIPSLREVIEGPLRDLQHTPSLNLARTVSSIWGILELALRHGRSEAYQLFVEYDFAGLVCKFYPMSQIRTLISAANVGLDTDTVQVAAGEAFLNYLFEAHNLRTTLISFAHSKQASLCAEALGAAVQGLLSMCPDKSSWDDCRGWLSLVSKWTQDGARLHDYNEQGLGGEKLPYSFMRDISSDALDIVMRSLDEFFEGQLHYKRSGAEQGNGYTPPFPAASHASGVQTFTSKRPKAELILARTSRMFRWREGQSQGSKKMDLDLV